MKITANVIIYTGWYCSFCKAAKKLLDSKKIAYEEIPVSKNDTQWKEMEKLSGNKTVPQIFIDNKAIGGYDDLSLLEKNGKLDRLLK